MKDFFLALGGGNEIGASCYLLRLKGAHILIDAGMRFNSRLAYPDFGLLQSTLGGTDRLNGLLVTHAHLDHSGALARVQYDFPNLDKYTTAPTRDLLDVMLRDAIRVSGKQKGEDWYIVDRAQQLIEDLLASIKLVSFQQPFELDKFNIKVTAYEAGHILGAASYLIEQDGQRIFHTGDISLHAQRTIAGLELDRVSDIDVLIIESTYAFQPHYINESIEEQYFNLATMVSRTITKDGRALIPAFALGRAQEIATLFGDLFEQKVLSPFPVYLDGLVKPICEVYQNNRNYLLGRERTKAGHVIYDQYVRPMPDEFYPNPANINRLGPMCIISSSGMLLDHTRSAAYAQTMLSQQRDAIVFSGYLDGESPGSRLLALEAGKAVKINGRLYERHSDVLSYHLSAHAPSRDLCKVIEKINPKQVILIHGDYRHTGDVQFLEFIMTLEKKGIHVHQAANKVPIYL